jgi:hypothetical protein
MSLLLQVPMTTSTGGTVLESYSVGDVLIWKANRGKLPELVTLIDSYQADVNYRNQVRCGLPSADWIALRGVNDGGALCCVVT